jgi:hypothetical protein
MPLVALVLAVMPVAAPRPSAPISCVVVGTAGDPTFREMRAAVQARRHEDVLVAGEREADALASCGRTAAGPKRFDFRIVEGLTYQILQMHAEALGPRRINAAHRYQARAVELLASILQDPHSTARQRKLVKALMSGPYTAYGCVDAETNQPLDPAKCSDQPE